MPFRPPTRPLSRTARSYTFAWWDRGERRAAVSNDANPDWTDEELAAYLGSADDPMDDEPVFESPEILDLYAGYTPANPDDGGTVA